MSVSTTKSQSEQNDINDPVVQDVLNEFRDELQSSKNTESNIGSLHSLHMNPNQPSIAHNNIPHQLINSPQYYNQQGSAGQQGPQGGPQGPNQHPNMFYQQYSQQSPHNLQTNKNDYSVYINVELIKKNLIIVLVVFLIYHSGIINNIYDKIPDYLQENLTVFDVYIKTTIIFIVLYTISYLGYV